VNVVSSYVRLIPNQEGVAPGTTTRYYGAATWSGTSFAAPMIAAELARLRRAGMPPEEARHKVCELYPAAPGAAALPEGAVPGRRQPPRSTQPVV
jgi:hypothetical protein